MKLEDICTKSQYSEINEKQISLGLEILCANVKSFSIDNTGIKKCFQILYHAKSTSTLQPLYKRVHYNTIFDITRFKDRSQKCIDYIEK